MLAHSCHAPLVLRAVDETTSPVREGHRLRAEEMAQQISDDADAQLAAQQPLQATRRSS